MIKIKGINKKTSKGSALLSALLVVAIVASIATVMMIRQSANVRETQLIVNSGRAYLALQGVEDWAITTLSNHFRESNSKEAPLTFPIEMPTATHFYGAEVITGTITDASALFNINALSNPNYQISFSWLLGYVQPNLEVSETLKIARNITAWLTSSGADQIYLAADPPYRAGHQLMRSVSELRLVQGITPTIYHALAPYISALPTRTNQINLFNASLPVLLTLGLTQSQAKALIACRQSNKAISDVAYFKVTCLDKLGITLREGYDLSNTSKYFLVHGYIKLGDQELNLYSLLAQRQDKKGKLTIVPLWQSLGSL